MEQQVSINREKQTSTRQERGLKLIEAGKVVKVPKVADEQLWIVESEKIIGKWYIVKFTGDDELVCDCEDFLYNADGQFCKHIWGTIMQELQQRRELLLQK